MRKNSFRAYRSGDLQAVWQDLREEDRQEVGHQSPAYLDGLDSLMTHGLINARTWDTERGPVCVLGVTPSDTPEVGVVWALASEAARPRWRFAVRHTEAVLTEMSSGYSVLSNFKDSRNIQQINWLRKLGFVFIKSHQTDDPERSLLEFVRIVQ